jgi:hypothetical protein
MTKMPPFQKNHPKNLVLTLSASSSVTHISEKNHFLVNFPMIYLEKSTKKHIPNKTEIPTTAPDVIRKQPIKPDTLPLCNATTGQAHMLLK